VQKLLKGILIAGVVVVALSALGVLAMNLYVQSAGTQKRIERVLSSGLKVPVHITSIIVTPWSGLKASGITVPQGPRRKGNFLEAEDFTAHFSWTALFQHRLDASDVSMNNPRVTWFQGPNGRWELPGQEEPSPAPRTKPKPAESPAAVAAASPLASPLASPGHTAAPPPPAPQQVAAATPAPPAHPWQVNVHKVMVNGATFDFWDEKGNRLAQLAGVDLDCLDPSAQGTRGQAACKEVSLHDRFFLRQMQTDWDFGDGLLKLSSFQTNVGGGKIVGAAQLDTVAKHTPFVADVKFDGVNVNELMTDAGAPPDEVSGTMNGWFDLRGNSGKTSSLNGSGQVNLIGGQMQGIGILQMLGRGLQIPDLVELNLKTGELDWRVVNGVTNIDQLVLQSQNLRVTGSGTVDSDGHLDFNARLTIDAIVMERLPQFILDAFKPGSTPATRYIDFQLGNTISHPKTRLLEELLGHRIQSQMSGLMQLIFKKPPTTREPSGPAP
jgi:uncharacterized protein involved in outer membrane biogenesis